MNKIKKVLLTLSLATCFSASAFDFRLGPKIGLGLGTPIGLKEGSSKVLVGIPLALVTQFDFGNIGVDTGIGYRYNILGLSEKDAATGDETTFTLGYSAIEIPATVYYKLKTERGFFKFGGGLAGEFGFGKIHEHAETDFGGGGSGSASDSGSFSDIGLTQYDVYLVAKLGYEWVWDSWALALDLEPKYGLVNRVKDATKFGTGNTKNLHSLWFDLGVSFLF
jgi:hypothetical protein